MSAFANYCLAYENLGCSIYTYDDTIIMNIDNENNDSVSLTLSPVQALTLAKGLQNVVAQMPVQNNNYLLINGNMTLDFPIKETPQQSSKVPTPIPTIEKPVICLEKERPVA